MAVEILNCSNSLFKTKSNSKDESVPSVEFLLSIVRRGSLQMVRKGLCEDVQDNDIIHEHDYWSCSSRAKVLALCSSYLGATDHTLPRHWSRVTHDEVVTRVTHDEGTGMVTTRLMQWNMLSQSLATGVDKFSMVTGNTLEWEVRRWRIVKEILTWEPDIVCLQEVDHYRFLKHILESVGYQGYFVPKPDSPCIYVDNNNGPDGCAVFIRVSMYEVVRSVTRTLSVWGVASNQVAMAHLLRHQKSGHTLWVVTTHLKARTGDINVMMRAEQGRDLVTWMDNLTATAPAPLIVTGDLNAEPCEPVLGVLTTDLGVTSVYDNDMVTTAKVRAGGRETKALDYILTSSPLCPVANLSLPSPHNLGPSLLPSTQFPSDHLSLVADIAF